MFARQYKVWTAPILFFTNKCESHFFQDKFVKDQFYATIEFVLTLRKNKVFNSFIVYLVYVS